MEVAARRTSVPSGARGRVAPGAGADTRGGTPRCGGTADRRRVVRFPSGRVALSPVRLPVRRPTAPVD